MTGTESGRRGNDKWRRQQIDFPRLTWRDEHGEWKLRILWPGWYLVRYSRSRRAKVYRQIADPRH